MNDLWDSIRRDAEISPTWAGLEVIGVVLLLPLLLPAWLIGETIKRLAK